MGFCFLPHDGYSCHWLCDPNTGDIAAIDAAINNLNQVMQAASAKMYQQTGPQPGADPNQGAGFQGGQQAHSNPNDDVQDADFEEVK